MLRSPRAAEVPADDAEMRQFVRAGRRTQIEILEALEELRRVLGLQVDAGSRSGVEDSSAGAGDGREAPRHTIINAPDDGDDVLGEVRRLLAAQGPIGSAEEGRQLDALPRTPPNVSAIDRVLRAWPEARSDLLFISVEQVVARFGFPPRAVMNGPYLLWMFTGSRVGGKGPDKLYFKITRNRVVQASMNDI
jgi:hypothetical protein